MQQLALHLLLGGADRWTAVQPAPFDKNVERAEELTLGRGGALLRSCAQRN